LISAIFISAALPHICSLAKDVRWVKTVVPGIKYTQIKASADRGPLRIHILSVNANDPKIRIKPALAKRRIGMIEGVDRIAKRENAVAAVNGSFFESKKTPHLPIGILIADGKIVNKSLLHRAAIGITGGGDIVFGIPKMRGEIVNPKTGERFVIWGINRPRKLNEVILYTPEYGEITKTNKFGVEIVVSRGRVIEHARGNSKIPEDGCVVSFHGQSRKLIDMLPVGSDAVVTFGLSGGWETVNQALTAGPLLIEDGEIVVEKSIEEEGFSGRILSPSARTAVGIDRSGHLLFFVVDKKRMVSVGATYAELAEIMKREGVVTGIALDGGGPSTLYVDGEIKNHLMYGFVVPVSNALIVEKEGYRFVAKPILPPKPKAEASIKMGKTEGLAFVSFEAVAYISIAEALTADSFVEGFSSPVYSEDFLSFAQSEVVIPEPGFDMKAFEEALPKTYEEILLPGLPSRPQSLFL
jgi:exopolysaccharide biosynthesis protein